MKQISSPLYCLSKQVLMLTFTLIKGKGVLILLVGVGSWYLNIIANTLSNRTCIYRQCRAYLKKPSQGQVLSLWQAGVRRHINIVITNVVSGFNNMCLNLGLMSLSLCKPFLLHFPKCIILPIANPHPASPYLVYYAKGLDTNLGKKKIRECT